MYGAGRKVNREMIMQLHGARCYFDCTAAVLATDGQLMPDAQKVADKLDIQVFHFCPPDPCSLTENNQRIDSVASDVSSDFASEFDSIWQKFVMPLEGMVLQIEKGRKNTILKIGWTGLDRITSNGKANTLPIEIFRSAICHLLSHGTLTRQQINDQYAKRGSSGVFLILEQIPLFERTHNPMGLRFKR